MRITSTVTNIIIILFFSIQAQTQDLPSDTFNDNTTADMWTMFGESLSDCWLEEINQRLEVRTTENAQDVVAGYISHLWKLSLAHDFSLKVDFHVDFYVDSPDEFPDDSSSDLDAWAQITLTADPTDPGINMSILM